jgi:hypothetical protein
MFVICIWQGWWTFSCIVLNLHTKAAYCNCPFRVRGQERDISIVRGSLNPCDLWCVSDFLLHDQGQCIALLSGFWKSSRYLMASWAMLGGEGCWPGLYDCGTRKGGITNTELLCEISTLLTVPLLKNGCTVWVLRRAVLINVLLISGLINKEAVFM